MMGLTFDLISDLHVDSWPEEFDWTGRATSPHALVLGDIAQDRDLLVHALTNLAQCYQAVFDVDGNTEHKNFMDDLGASYVDLTERLNSIKNLVYLQDNVVVIDGVAILGTNGWWGYDFDQSISPEQSALWHKEFENYNIETIQNIKRMSTADANYMISGVKRLQTHLDVKKIVMATHTVPNPALIAHDIELDGSLKFNTLGNRYMQHALAPDLENKIHTWCFGHYHRPVDQTMGGINYLCNPRGRGNTPWSQTPYYPRRIEISF